MNSLKNLWHSFREFRHGPKGILFTLALLCLVIIFAVTGRQKWSNSQPLDYTTCLDQVMVQVNGENLTGRDLAYYVAYYEMDGEKRAELFEKEDERADYWNLYVDGLKVKKAASEDAMASAVHDEIFYRMAVEEAVELTGEEQESLANCEQDFWADLCDYEGDKKLGITREEIHAAMEKIAIAQRYQTIYALQHNKEYEDYDIKKEAYEKLLEQNTYKVKEKAWERVDFGNVIVGK